MFVENYAFYWHEYGYSGDIHVMACIVLYCIVLYCIVLFCFVLFSRGNGWYIRMYVLSTTDLSILAVR